jgi:hypothetical protein
LDSGRNSLSVVHCGAVTSAACAVLRKSTMCTTVNTPRTRYKVTVNFVYPVLAIAAQPDKLDRKVMDKGEHVELERVRPNGLTRKFEQYCCVPAGQEPLVK